MRLFQYWDSGAPPGEIAAWIEEVRSLNPEMKHRLYDRDDASWFIRKNLGLREQRAFDGCAVPAMQADYFRLCALQRFGGLYVDADLRCVQPLAPLLQATPHGLAMLLNGHITNSLMFMRLGGDAYVEACLRLCTCNIEQRCMPNVYTATGPGVLTAIQAVLQPELAPALVASMDNLLQRDWLFAELVESARRQIPVTDSLLASFRDLTLADKPAMRPWIAKTNPPYKQTPRHWLNWPGSIYAAAETAPG